MDESDNLISLTLKQSGWSGDVPAVAAIEASQLLEIVSWGFAQIQDAHDGNTAQGFKFELPKGVAQRHRVAATLAGQFKAMGYSYDCGYNHLLYPTEADTRRMLLWLIQKLPRTEKEINEVETPRLQFRNGVVKSMRKWMEGSQIVKTAGKKSASVLPASWLENEPTLQRRRYIAFKQPFVTDSSLCHGNKLRSLLDLNALAQPIETSHQSYHTISHVDEIEIQSVVQTALASSSSSSDGLDFQNLKKTSPQVFSKLNELSLKEANLANKQITPASQKIEMPASKPQGPTHEEELAAMEAELGQLREQCALNESQLHEYEASCEDQINLNRQVEARCALKNDDLQEVEKEVLIRQETLEMLSDASNNIAKLQGICAKSAERLLQLAEEWETHRLPLIKQIETHSATQVYRQERAKELLEEMQEYRSDMRELGDTYAQKQEQRRLLEKKYESMPKGINRSMYTLRILDIIKQVHKQKADIQKIVRDIRSVQKQINISSEKLKRSEAITDETLFQAANDSKLRPEKKQMYIECYRLFTNVRELFEELITCVSECGKRENQSRDLEIWIAQMTHRVNMTNLDRIHHDMQQVKNENQALIQEIQTLTLDTP